MNQAQNKMSLLEKISYGCGNLGICLSTTIISTFIMFFYSDVIKLTLEQIGLIMLLGGIIDAISNIVLGFFVDKFNSRWGKIRPYLLFFSIPMAVACFLVFRVPQASASIRFWYALCSYLIYTVICSCIVVPQNVLLASITDEPADRLQTNMFGSLGTNIGQLIVNAFALTLVAVLGGTSAYDGYNYTVALFAAVGALLILFEFKYTRERVSPPAGEKISLKDILQSFKNLPWLLTTLTTLLIISIFVTRSSQTLYFAQYILGSPEKASILLSITNIIGIPITLIIPIVATKIGKRNLVIVGCLIGILGSLSVYWMKTNFLLVVIASVIISIGIAFVNGIVFVMSAESVDYGEWKNKKRIQGTLMSFIGFSVKVSISVVSLLLSFILAKAGYVGGSETQSPSALAGIEFNYIWLPIILFIIIMMANCFYTLDKKYPEIKAELDRRRQEAMGE